MKKTTCKLHDNELECFQKWVSDDAINYYQAVHKPNYSSARYHASFGGTCLNEDRQPDEYTDNEIKDYSVRIEELQKIEK